MSNHTDVSVIEFMRMFERVLVRFHKYEQGLFLFSGETSDGREVDVRVKNPPAEFCPNTTFYVWDLDIHTAQVWSECSMYVEVLAKK